MHEADRARHAFRPASDRSIVRYLFGERPQLQTFTYDVSGYVKPDGARPRSGLKR